MATLEFDIVATEPFNNNYHTHTIEEIHNYVEDVWETYIEDGSGDYSASFTIRYGLEIPASALTTSSGDDLWDRAHYADDWLQNTTGYPFKDLYMVCDYWQGGSMNGASLEVAGTYENKVSLLNSYKANYIPGPMGSQGPKGVMAHEMLHMFIEEYSPSSEHYPYVYSNNETSLMYDGDIESRCVDLGSPEKVVKDVSSCTENKVKTWIDNNY